LPVGSFMTVLLTREQGEQITDEKRWTRQGAYMVKGLWLVNLKERDRIKTKE
jgi:deferrochelatase/peroxidase EfeB